MRDRIIKVFCYKHFMKKRLLILFIMVIIVGVVNGEESKTQLNFTISGCNFEGTGLANGSCSSNGDYFCGYKNGNYLLYNTIYDPTGCSYGKDTYTSGQLFCCPTGYFCENGAEGPVCNLREGLCSNQSTQNDCEGIGCYWLQADGGTCVESPSDYSCDVYPNSKTCTNDRFGLGQRGIGTKICGTYFSVNNIEYVVPFDSCRCEWDNSCKLTYNTVEEFGNGTANSFKCMKSFGIGKCVDGTQLINWTATPQIISGYPSGIPLSVLEATKCVNNTAGAKRDCGTPILKLPGFSLFSFFISLGIVSLFYLWTKKLK